MNQYNNQFEYFSSVAEMPQAKTENKPVVKYRQLPGALPPELYGTATVIPVEHPAGYLNGRVVYTSYIVAVGENGSFETRNTRYELEAA